MLRVMLLSLDPPPPPKSLWDHEAPCISVGTYLQLGFSGMNASGLTSKVSVVKAPGGWAGCLPAAALLLGSVRCKAPSQAA